jgi:hypothetical protein
MCQLFKLDFNEYRDSTEANDEHVWVLLVFGNPDNICTLIMYRCFSFGHFTYSVLCFSGVFYVQLHQECSIDFYLSSGNIFIKDL